MYIDSAYVGFQAAVRAMNRGKECALIVPLHTSHVLMALLGARFQDLTAVLMDNPHSVCFLGGSD
jgi:hypothetical protein